MPAAKRPNLSAHWASVIDRHVNGMFAGPIVPLPRDVARVNGNVTDARIEVTMRDGTVWLYEGGRYAARKRNGCYAPLTPKPVEATR